MRVKAHDNRAVIDEIKDAIATGQIRPSESLVDAQPANVSGRVVVFLEPIYPGQTDDIPPGRL